jgi:hypothetical protein
MNDIEQTQRVIHNFEADLATHKGKKQKLVVNIGDDKNDDRIQKLDNAIKSTKKMIKISRVQSKCQMDEMGKTMKGLDRVTNEEIASSF